MKINRARQQESVAVFGHETSLIRDVLDNLELEHALTWLLEAISQHQSGELESEPWHLYQTTLFAMYVDYDNGKVRLSAALACHDADLEISLKDLWRYWAGKPPRRRTRSTILPAPPASASTATATRISSAGGRNVSRTSGFIPEPGSGTMPYPFQWPGSAGNPAFLRAFVLPGKRRGRAVKTRFILLPQWMQGSMFITGRTGSSGQGKTELY